MEVEVKHRLTTVSTGIGHDSVAALAQALLLRHLRARNEQVSQESLILGTAILHGHYVRFRNDQRMDRCLGIDVVECQRLVVLINDLGRNRPLNNLTKETIVHGSRLTFPTSARTSRIVCSALDRYPEEECRDNPRPL